MGSIINVGVTKWSLQKIKVKNFKKVEHIWEKSVKMELLKKPETEAQICSTKILPKNCSDCKM